jgi:hypothetical protein
MIAAATGLFTGVVKPILDKFIPDAEKRLEAEQLFFRQAHEASMGQLEVNKQEAAHGSLFVAGWRPFIGWVCGASLAYSVIVYSFLSWFLDVVSISQGFSVPPLPKPDTTMTMEIVFAMLGFGGLRSWEKYKGVAK